MPTMDVMGAPLHWREDGAGTAPPMVLLHANPGDSRDFDAIVPALAARGRVLRLDWPGYGGSPAPQPPERAGADLFLDAFRQWADALELRSMHLLGNSVGGNVAVRYALAQPERVRSLTLVSGGGFTRHTPVTRAFCRLQGLPAFNRAIAGVFTRGYLRRRTQWTRAMIARADGEQHSRAAHRVNAAVWRSFLAPQHDLRKAAAGVRAPVLLVNGRRDPVIPARSDGRHAAAAMPHAEAHVLPCGHAPFAEIPEEFLAVLLPFLQRSAGTAD